MSRHYGKTSKPWQSGNINSEYDTERNKDYNFENVTYDIHESQSCVIHINDINRANTVNIYAKQGIE